MSSKVNVHNHGTQAHSLPGSSITLKPGPNHIDTEVWEEAKKNKMIAHHLEAKTFVEHKLTAAEKKEEKAAEKAEAKAETELDKKLEADRKAASAKK